jgi:protein-disulfide isomerase-like protein with CxxC motif
MKSHIDFRSALEMGVRGFPSTLVRENGRLTTVSRGWLPLTELERTLGRWLG